MDSILIIEDTDSLREVLCTVLDCEGYRACGAASAEEALQLFAQQDFTLVLCDLKLPNKSGLDFLKEAREIKQGVPVIVMTAYGSIDIAVQAMKLGATDFISKPFDPAMLCNLIEQIAKHRRIVDRAPGKVRHQFITQSPNMELVLHQARKLAPLSTPVLILGESGTGKELIARYIHEQSPRVKEEFIAVNCASMPGELLESEFFGHEAGAFTGATERRLGLFQVADNGTIFLDEIGNMPYELQVKLLRTLQESEIKRLGSNITEKINTRVLSATNCNIEIEVKNGRFREDLFYRLGVVMLEIPPLRERPADITLLANYFLKCFDVESNETQHSITPEAMRMLEEYSWPGNVRELENTIERAMIFSEGALTPECFELHSTISPQEAASRGRTLPEIAAIASRGAEIQAILQALAETSGNKSKAAKILGVSYKTLLNKIRDYEIAPQHA